jgi:molecular chaperone GrpE (heat shock protein)
MQSAAAPAAQLALQAHLLEAEGKPVAARDMLAVARNLVRALETEGLLLEEKPGQRVAFDPNRHEPLSTETPIAVGQPALVKLPGLSFQGALLRKAGVTPAP